MKIIKVECAGEIPDDFTGIAEYSNGNREWYKEGKLHREGGPAVEYPIGTKLWFKEGKRHRLDGPAIEYSHGDKEYWVNGETLQTNIFIYGKIFLGKEKGKYGLEWLRFLTEDKIEEYPIVPGHEYEFIEIKYFTLEEFLNRKV
ncbi:MAG TPA: hypothetical protein PLP33_07325 [Leptospiraceae bacterium]|nr:hypothetical protein [Leptospiraceae bacterium]